MSIKTSTTKRCGPFVDHAGKAWPGLWSGRIQVYDGKTYLWSETCSVQRVSRNDAQLDAQIMRDDLIAEQVAA